MNLQNLKVWAIRDRTTGQYAMEDDAGDMAFGPLCAETLLFTNDGGDDERLLSHMSAAPGGHEAVEQVEFFLSLTEPAR